MTRVLRTAGVAMVLWLLGTGVAEAGLSLRYPTRAAPAAGQAGDIFDVDIRTTEGGVLDGALRREGDEQWRALDVVALTETVPRGLSEATAIVPPGTPAGRYDLRVRLLTTAAACGGSEWPLARWWSRITGCPPASSSAQERRGRRTRRSSRFLTAIDRSARADVDVLGTSVQGRPLHLVRIGAEGARHRILIVCSQHGNEPAGRETCLRELRRLALTADARTTDYLRSTSVFFIPSANPDGRELNTRGNADGLDLNRDHLRLSTVEAQAMARALRDLRPDFVADLHEFGTSSPDRPALEVIWPRHLNVDEDVRTLGRAWATTGCARARRPTASAPDRTSPTPAPRRTSRS